MQGAAELPPPPPISYHLYWQTFPSIDDETMKTEEIAVPYAPQ